MRIFVVQVVVAAFALSGLAPVDAEPALRTSYGAAVLREGALDVAKVVGMSPRLVGQEVRVVGQVREVCKREGCWLTLVDAPPASDALNVTFKGQAFTVPAAIAGRTIVASGVLHAETVSIEARRHLAEDAGRSAAEIAKITTPRWEVSLEADGLTILGGTQ